ncbi:hypothetical protein Lalb_Chr05g0215221 [Lupinus albus]|uniref:Uncharacterized protein n=1 Tax=Lupinus albus TaxID=3870 RepID=A0A6A4QH52_LUPAL|nr:hypothetical protein Lalb_Chr05g0215221 [Lupinus albus]
MALISELSANLILLATRPFSLLKLAYLIVMRTALIVTYAWTELITATIIFNLNIILGTITWTFGLISLPAKVVNAFQRERQLEQKLHEMQNKLESLIWDQKELQERFQMVVKEHKMMELLVIELEEEHDMAIAKIEKLETKLQDQINENLQLKEIQGKAYWSSKDQNDTDSEQNIHGSSYNNPVMQCKPSYNRNGISLQDLLMHKDILEIDNKTRNELLKLLKTGNKSGSVTQVKPEMMSKDVVEMRGVLDQRRDIAFSQSLFSAIMSLIVGVTIWEAEDPCMPLVVALFAVVGMSLKSVVQFFSTIKNKPASDAVALLSFNWFILGTLTYPSLPRVAHMLAPILLRAIDQTTSRFGLPP